MVKGCAVVLAAEPGAEFAAPADSSPAKLRALTASVLASWQERLGISDASAPDVLARVAFEAMPKGAAVMSFVCETVAAQQKLLVFSGVIMICCLSEFRTTQLPERTSCKRAAHMRRTLKSALAYQSRLTVWLYCNG